MASRVGAACLAALLLCADHARADVTTFAGRRITAIVFDVDGRIVTESRLTTLVAAHVGDALDMAAVRESLVHLFSLATFEDVQVVADRRGDAVALTFALRSLKPIDQFEFRGGQLDGVNEGRLRRLVIERFGAAPRASRVADMARLVEEDLKQVGFLSASASARVTSSASADHSTVVFELTPGVRARVGTLVLVGEAGVPEPMVWSQLGVAPGRIYEPDMLSRRLERFLEQRRARGFFSARMTITAEPVDQGRAVNLTANAAQGPHVRVAFDGDAIPANRQADLAPVVREGSADQDLLEDSTIRIRDYLRAQGYRDARATFTRTEADAELVVAFHVTRGPQYRISRVDISGNSGLTLAQVQEHLKVRAGQPFSVSAINADLGALEGLYRREGFGAVSVRHDAVLEEPLGDGTQVPVIVRVTIAEQARTLVNTIAIDGTLAVPEATLREGLGLQPGKPYFATQLAIDRDALQVHYANLGYQSATVTTAVTLSRDGLAADIRFNVSEGVRVFVGHVLIVGNTRTSTATIERELQFKTSDPLGLEAISESQRRLASLGLFRRARISELRHGSDAQRDLLVTVEEAPATTVGYGGGVEALQMLSDPNNTGAAANLEFAPRAFFEIGRRNLFGKNRSINLFTRVSLRPQQNSVRNFSEYRVIGTFREPHALGTGAEAYLTGTLQQERRSSFNFSRRAFNAEVARKLTRQVSASGSYQIQRTEVFFNSSVDPSQQLLIDRVFPQVRLSSFSMSGVRDTRNDLADPLTGLFVSANGQIAGRAIGSEVGLVKTFLSAQKFTPIPHSPRIVFASSVRLGMATGLPRQVQATDASGVLISTTGGAPMLVTVRDLPASERFFAGGDTTVRGFALDQLGAANTIAKDGFPIGGGGLMILNAELRIPVTGAFGAVGFVDAGNVFARPSEIDFGKLRSAVGVGLRYKSPIGPIRVDVGFKTRRYDVTPGNRESASSLHISLGQAF